MCSQYSAFFSDIACAKNIFKKIVLKRTKVDEEQLFRFNRANLLFPPGGI